VDSNLKITNKGFQFLLQDVKVQVWAFLQQYLDMAEEMGLDLIEGINFLFQLALMQLGESYTVDLLTKTQKFMFDDLCHIGIIYQRKKKSSRFYPTRLATSLIKSVQEDPVARQGYIIIETNYRVYAYTSSPLQIAILSLFLELKSRFKNMVMGVLSRESVKEAFSNGITSEQIISFLTTHAHPEMRKQVIFLLFRK
jgi:transcription initiation factor TFIIH subunit 4